MAMDQHILSIIAVALNEGRHVDRLKQSIDRLRRPANVNIESILIDGGSGDGTPGLARKAGFTQVLESPGSSIPVCRNAAVRTATGDWIAFVDADCELAEDWLEQAARLLLAQQPVIAGWPAEPPHPPTWVQAAWHAHWTCKNPALEETAGQHVVRREGFRLVTTRNMILHREVFDRVHGFDEELPTGEDTDFVFRAHLLGIEVLGVPSLRVVHHGEPATLGEFFRQQLWHANRSSYKRIVKKTGARVGGNAPVFTAVFAAAVAMALAGLALITAGWFLTGIVLLLPLPALVIGPAVLIAARARQAELLLPLSALYAAYGFARALDLLGLFRRKDSWKSASQA